MGVFITTDVPNERLQIMPMLDFYTDKMHKINAEQEAMAKTCDDEKREKTPDEQEHYDSLSTDWEKYDKGRKECEERNTRAATLKPRKAIVPPGQGNPEMPEKRGNGLPKFMPTKVPRGFESAEQAYRAGKWCQAAILGNAQAEQWCKDYDVEYRVQVEHSNLKGGFLVPQEFSSAVIDLREEYGVARQKLRIVPMGTDSMVVPRRTGGLTAYWVGEETATTESDKTWDQIELNPRTLAALTRISKELSDDAAISIAADISSEMAYAFSNKEDEALFNGTGASTYGAIVGLISACATATATVYTTGTTRIAFSDLTFGDFETMIGKLPRFPGIRPEWYIHQVGFYASMARLADAAGGNTVDHTATGANRMQFLGYPVNFVNVMNSTLTDQAAVAGICYFGDIAMAATMGERAGITVDTTTDRYFEYRQIGIQAHERLDINVHDVGDTSNAGAVIMMTMQTS